MMELILNRIHQCQRSASFIVISPWKPKVRWFPKILTLAVRAPVRLPLSTSTVMDRAESGVLPVTPTGARSSWLPGCFQAGQA